VFQRLRLFFREECGAVTVDWVILTAAMAGFGIAMVTIVSTAALDPAEGIGAKLEDMDVAP
jgi:hypothetical protein